MIHPIATPTPMPALAPTLRPPPELAVPELEVEVGRSEVMVLLAVPVCPSPFVVSVAMEVVVLHSGSPSALRTTGP